ncbi:transmembrane protein 267 [Clupea harengus]|uniref:Transmembrane protein 267 n=1 Tax=Clupea harengus TaxID=7950 RepID=A0A6P8GDN3_CLUHA|nr:transmembrane protein 267 [Clupea harengus]
MVEVSAMRGFYSKLDSSSSSAGAASAGAGAMAPLSLAVETEKAQALLQTFSTASLLASGGLGLFCLLADHLLQTPAVLQHAWLRALLDNGVHGLIGLWSWAIVIGLRKKSDFYEVVLAGFLASVIDLDHFYLAGSLSLKAALNLPHRPPLHCSTVIPALCFSLRLLMWALRLKDSWCSLPWMLFVALGSHHVRDGTRHGLWLWPLGHTAPISYWLYAGITTTLPHLCSVLMYLTGTRHILSTKHGVAIDV